MLGVTVKETLPVDLRLYLAFCCPQGGSVTSCHVEVPGRAVTAARGATERRVAG